MSPGTLVESRSDLRCVPDRSARSRAAPASSRRRRSLAFRSCERVIAWDRPAFAEFGVQARAECEPRSAQRIFTWATRAALAQAAPACGSRERGVRSEPIICAGLVVRKATVRMSSLPTLESAPLAHWPHDNAPGTPIPALDGLRGLAVLAVLALHLDPRAGWTFPLPNTVTHSLGERLAAHIHSLVCCGWAGVDLFFVLSGYLITRGLITPSSDPTRQRLGKFWARRFLRIFPLYYALLLAGTFVSVVVRRSPPSLFYWVYLQNYAQVFEGGELSWSAHLWSLAVEEQFYLVWPLAVLLIPRKRLLPLTLVLVMICVLLRAGLLVRSPLDHDRTVNLLYRATFTRMDGLLLGALAAIAQRQPTHVIARVWHVVRRYTFFLGFAVVGVLYLSPARMNPFNPRVLAVGYFALALTFASAVSICSDSSIPRRVRNALTWRPLVACGKVSYGMYLFHWPIVVLLAPWLNRIQRPLSAGSAMVVSIVQVGLGVAISYAIANVSFKYFESPILKLKSKFHDSPVPSASARAEARSDLLDAPSA